MAISREQFLLYYQRFFRVMDYLDRHLDDDEIRLEHLAEVANLSRFHFERMYAERMKETPMATVRRLRLQRARQYLLNGEHTSITTLAVESGYGSVAAFSRAFTRAFKQAPTKIALLPPQLGFIANPTQPPLEIVQLPAIPIVRHAFSGRAAEVFGAGDEFTWVVNSSGTCQHGYRHWVVHPDGWVDPARYPDKWVRMWHCATVNTAPVKNNLLDFGFLPPGMYARFVYVGKHVIDIPHCIARVSMETAWQVADGAMLRSYPTSIHFTPVSERIVHFFLPVAPR